jgi:enediyne biosynthesis protein E4
VLVDEVRSGSSYDSNNDMRVHFGLGGATKIDRVDVRWPSGLTESFSAKIDAFNELKEGTGTVVKK